MNQARICIYHGDCLDGQGAAIAMFRRFPDTEFYFGVYSEAPPEDVDGRDVFLVDFSYPKAVIEDLLQRVNHLTIIDHHRTAMEALATFTHPRLTKVFSYEHSGAVLAWKYFNPQDPVPELLWYIEDRDLWKFESQDTRAITMYAYSLNFAHPADWLPYVTPAVWTDAKSTFLVGGQALVRQNDKRVRDLVGDARPMTISNHEVLVVNCNHFYASDVAHELAFNKPFGATYRDVKDKRVFSLRSVKGGVNVAEIAEKYGGGGHEHAAGFSVPLNTHWAYI